MSAAAIALACQKLDEVQKSVFVTNVIILKKHRGRYKRHVAEAWRGENAMHAAHTATVCGAGTAPVFASHSMRRDLGPY